MILSFFLFWKNSKFFQFVSLEEAQENKVQTGRVPSNSAYIHFDSLYNDSHDYIRLLRTGLNLYIFRACKRGPSIQGGQHIASASWRQSSIDFDLQLKDKAAALASKAPVVRSSEPGKNLTPSAALLSSAYSLSLPLSLPHLHREGRATEEPRWKTKN
jgi:hypothetical protein